MKKKIVLWVMLIMSFFSIGIIEAPTSEASAISAETMRQKFEELKKKYPEGSTWNGSYKNLSWQCMGWAETVCDYLFGENPRNWVQQTNWNNLCVGDHVRLYYRGEPNNHSIVITNMVGDTIYYADCNGNGDNKVHWNRTMSRSTLLSKALWFKSQPDNWVRTLEGSGDKTPPTISDAKVVGVDANGYMLQCSISDSSGISSVKCATWTLNNDQDDLIWNDMVNTSPGIWKLYINFSKHNSEKNVLYLNHIYAYDKNNNQSCVSVDYNEWNPPVISYGEIIGIDDNGYMIECKVSDDTGLSRVSCATWTNENGQDDLVWNDMVNTSPGIWKLYIHFSGHGKNTTYANDIYAYDTFQKESKCYSVPFDFWDLDTSPFAVYKYNDHINVINLASTSKNAVIFAKYDGSKLVNSSFNNENFTSGERKNYSKSGNEYNVFIWDSLRGMKPLTN